jgi:hypothetical protein
MPKSFQFLICALVTGAAAVGCGSGHDEAALPDVQANNNAKPEMTITVRSQDPPEIPKSDTPPPIKHHTRHRRKRVEPPPTEPPIEADPIPVSGGDAKPDPGDGGTMTPADPPVGEPTPPDPGKTGNPPDDSH